MKVKSHKNICSHYIGGDTVSVYYSDVLFKGDAILIDDETVLIGTRTENEENKESKGKAS